jgi:hypothetical protein
VDERQQSFVRRIAAEQPLPPGFITRTKPVKTNDNSNDFIISSSISRPATNPPNIDVPYYYLNLMSTNNSCYSPLPVILPHQLQYKPPSANAPTTSASTYRIVHVQWQCTPYASDTRHPNTPRSANTMNNFPHMGAPTRNYQMIPAGNYEQQPQQYRSSSSIVPQSSTVISNTELDAAGSVTGAPIWPAVRHILSLWPTEHAFSLVSTRQYGSTDTRRGFLGAPEETCRALQSNIILPLEFNGSYIQRISKDSDYHASNKQHKGDFLVEICCEPHHQTVFPRIAKRPYQRT